MKKVLSAVLAAAAVSSLGVTAFAEKYDLSSPVFYVKKADKVTADTVLPESKAYIRLEQVAYFILNEVTPPVAVASETGDPLPEVGPDEELAKKLIDKDLFKFSYKKGKENSKMIKSIKLTEEFQDVDGWSDMGESADRPTPVAMSLEIPEYPSARREGYIKIELNDLETDDELKINPEFTFTAKEDIKELGIKDGDKFTFDIKLWIKNREAGSPADFLAGEGGVVVKPEKNDDNEVSWSDENNDLALLEFQSDDDAEAFFPKLSTKWDRALLNDYFADQDAFFYNFVRNPKLSSTSRAALSIYDPFYDFEDDTTLDPETVVIYKVVDGELVDDTANWKYQENDEGDMVYTCRTRQLGSYVFCEKAVEA